MASLSDNKKSTKLEGYKGFGSFLSESVEDLILIENFTPPTPLRYQDTNNDIQHKNEEEDLYGLLSTSFGSHLKEKHFLLESSFTFINHGAFGAPARIIFEEADKWRRYAERQPLRFIDRELLPMIVGNIQALASFLNVKQTSLSLLPNVTTALNSVIRSTIFQSNTITKENKKEDAVMFFNIGYGAAKKIVRETCNISNNCFVPLEMAVPIPFSNSQLKHLLRQYLEQHKATHNIHLAVIDHITSNTGCILPIKSLIEICHEFGVKVLVDGAHSLGSIDLPQILPTLNADFYTGNLHKWFLCPRGVAFLYVLNEMDKKSVKSCIISHGYDAGFLSQFIWDGARDYSAALSIQCAIDFWGRIGQTKVIDYCHSLVSQAAEMLKKEWNTSVLFPSSMFASMALVELPAATYNNNSNSNNNASNDSSKATSANAKHIQDLLHFEYKIEVPIKCLNDILYTRISAHIYNEVKDYEALSTAITDIIERHL